jgi:hypothetical protein
MVCKRESGGGTRVRALCQGMGQRVGAWSRGPVRGQHTVPRHTCPPHALQHHTPFPATPAHIHATPVCPSALPVSSPTIIAAPLPHLLSPLPTPPPPTHPPCSPSLCAQGACRGDPDRRPGRRPAAGVPQPLHRRRPGCSSSRGRRPRRRSSSGGHQPPRHAQHGGIDRGQWGS